MENKTHREHSFPCEFIYKTFIAPWGTDWNHSLSPGKETLSLHGK